MKKFIEVTTVYREECSIGYANRECQRLIDLNTVSAIFSNNKGYFVELEDDQRFSVTNESYDTVRDALLNGGSRGNGGTVSEMRSRFEYLEEYRNGGNSIIDKFCELHSDHTWVMQALANILLMCKEDKTSYHPAILLGCYDKELEKMNEAVYGAVLCMQKRIKELEEQTRIMTEPKKPQNV